MTLDIIQLSICNFIIHTEKGGTQVLWPTSLEVGSYRETVMF